MGEQNFNYTWIKIPISLLDDPDFNRLSYMATDLYFKLYLIAAKGDAEGFICTTNKVLGDIDIAWYLRHTPEDTSKALEELVSCELLTREDNGYKVTRFLDEQGPGDNTKREYWRERQRAHRAKHRSEKIEDQDVEKNRLRGREEGQEDVNLTPPHPFAPSGAAACLDACFIELNSNEAKEVRNVNDECGPYSKIVGLLEFVTVLIASQYCWDRDIPSPGWYRILPAGLEKIKAAIPDPERMNDQQLWEAMNYFTWYCIEYREDVRILDKPLALYQNGLGREIILHPEVYRQSREIRVVREVTGREPDTQLYPKIYEAIDALNPLNHIEILADYYRAWIAKGYSKKNFDWLFDWYANNREDVFEGVYQEV